MLLSIERSCDIASAAIFDGDTCLAYCEEPGRGTGDAWSLLTAVLAQAHIEASSLTAFVAGTGPGSFSGIRSALALVQGVAAPTGAPVHGVSTAAAAIARERARDAAAPRIHVLGDARRGHVWVCSERLEDETPFTHTPSDFALLSAPRNGGAPEEGMSSFADFLQDHAGDRFLLADPVRLAPLLKNTPAENAAPMLADARDIAALDRAGSFGPADPVYLHPAVVGPVISAV